MSAIQVCADTNESGGSRMKPFTDALNKDIRFAWCGYKSLDADLQFTQGDLTFNMELKEPSDYVQSVLGGHLYNQCLTLRERGLPCAILITDEWSKVMEANRNACLKRRASDQIASNYLRLKSFKKRTLLNGIRTFYPGDDSGFFDGDNVWTDLKEFVFDLFEGGDLTGFRARPTNGEREVVALSTLLPGMGPATLSPLLEDYTLRLIPRGEFAKDPGDYPGIGKKREAVLDKMICKVYGMVKA